MTASLRVPIFGRGTGVDSLSDLKRAHKSALDRIQHGKPLNTVEKPKVFDSVFYESKDRLLARPHVVFEYAPKRWDFLRLSAKRADPHRRNGSAFGD